MKSQVATAVMSAMFCPPIRWFFLLLFLAGAGPVSAHAGYESESDVRIYADRMELNIRTTLGFAWKILGDRAPADAGASGQAIAGPLVEKMAPEWFEVDSGGKQMVPKSVHCMFEVDQHVFIQVIYDRPPTWPLVLRAHFFDFFDPLTFSTIRVFDQSADPYNREIKPSVEERIHRAKPVFTYDPNPSVEMADSVPPVSDQIPEKPKPQEFRGYGVAALLLILAWMARRGSSKRSDI